MQSSPGVLMWWKAARTISGAFYKALIPFMRLSTSQLKHLPKPYLLTLSPLGVGISTYEFEGTQTFRP